MGHRGRLGGERAQVLPLCAARRKRARSIAPPKLGPRPPHLGHWGIHSHAVAPWQVAIVFRSDAEAEAADTLLGDSMVQPNRPLPLRFCLGCQTFCTELCFSGATDLSCAAHDTGKTIGPTSAQIRSQILADEIDVPESPGKRQKAAEPRTPEKISKPEISKPEYKDPIESWLLDNVSEPSWEQLPRFSMFGCASARQIVRYC